MNQQWLQEKLRQRKEVLERIGESAELLDEVLRVAQVAREVLQQGGRIFLCGNGGSFVDALHIAAELTGRYYYEGRKPLPAQVLGSNPASLTAISNDYSYEEVFARELRAFARRGDMLWGLTTSGKSLNVLRAMETAGDLGLIRVGFCRAGETPLRSRVDFYLGIPATETPLIQEGHKILGHLICEMLDAYFMEERS